MCVGTGRGDGEAQESRGGDAGGTRDNPAGARPEKLVVDEWQGWVCYQDGVGDDVPNAEARDDFEDGKDFAVRFKCR